MSNSFPTKNFLSYQSAVNQIHLLGMCSQVPHADHQAKTDISHEWQEVVFEQRVQRQPFPAKTRYKKTAVLLIVLPIYRAESTNGILNAYKWCAYQERDRNTEIHIRKDFIQQNQKENFQAMVRESTRISLQFRNKPKICVGNFPHNTLSKKKCGLALILKSFKFSSPEQCYK